MIRGVPEAVDFARGEVDVIFSVDLFNEGLDVPAIDTILLLRPTASPVVFLQQLGRGLRRSEGKTRVTAIDFVGNHRSFLLPARWLAGLVAAGGRDGAEAWAVDESDGAEAAAAGTAGSPTGAAAAAAAGGTVTDTELRRMLTDGFTLPPGCRVHYELTAVETLLDLLPARSGSRLAAFVQAWIHERGTRPTAVQTFRAGFNPATAPGKWFAFLDDHGHLTDDEHHVALRHGPLLAHVASMSITKSYKLVALRALLRHALGSLLLLDPIRRKARIASDERLQLLVVHALDSMAKVAFVDDVSVPWHPRPLDHADSPRHALVFLPEA